MTTSNAGSAAIKAVSESPTLLMYLSQAGSISVEELISLITSLMRQGVNATQAAGVAALAGIHPLFAKAALRGEDPRITPADVAFFTRHRSGRARDYLKAFKGVQHAKA